MTSNELLLDSQFLNESTQKVAVNPPDSLELPKPPFRIPRPKIRRFTRKRIPLRDPFLRPIKGDIDLDDLAA